MKPNLIESGTLGMPDAPAHALVHSLHAPRPRSFLTQQEPHLPWPKVMFTSYQTKNKKGTLFHSIFRHGFWRHGLSHVLYIYIYMYIYRYIYIYTYRNHQKGKFVRQYMTGSSAVQKGSIPPTAAPEIIWTYCGWTKSCITLKPWKAIVCWYLQGNHQLRFP